ncbi:MAG: transposase family protein, partial [Streptococcaceae bacterium]|nr:transposase family protein [Streptococcaceae bacterium]
MLQTIEDSRQASKIKYSIEEVVLLVLIGQLVGAEGFTQIEIYLKHHETLIRKFLPLQNGITSHDTMERIIA